MPLSLLLPEADEPSGTHDAPPPLGAILVLSNDQGGDVGLFLRAARYLRAYPWCPLVLCGVVDISPDDLQEFRSLPSDVVFADLADGPTAWRAAVRGRPGRGRPARLDYLRRRIGEAKGELVRSALEDFSEGSSIRRRLRRAGLPAPATWADLCAMCDYLEAAIRNGWTEAETADEFGVAVTTLSRRCKRLFGAGWAHLVSTGCVEAVIEAGLRSLGVAPPPPPHMVDGQFVAS